jgi:hypothetical protein
LLIGKDDLFGGSSYVFSGDFYQLSVAGEKVYVTARDRAAKAASQKALAKAQSAPL